MQPGKKNDLPPAVTAVIALVGVGVLVAAAATALRDMRREARTAADAGAALDAAVAAATEPPARGCAAFAERNSNNGVSDREGHASSLNIQRPDAAAGQWAAIEPRTLVIRGVPSCDRAAILSAFPQSMPSAARASCTSFGFRLLRCEPSSGPPRTIDLTEACPCSDDTNPASCRCDF